MAIKNLAVTIGASVTVFSKASIRCNWFVCQNNAAHAMAIGGSDSAVGTPGVGFQLAVSGNNYQGREYIGQTNLALWYVAGTQNDLLNVTYDDGNDAND